MHIILWLKLKFGSKNLPMSGKIEKVLDISQNFKRHFLNELAKTPEAIPNLNRLEHSLKESLPGRLFQNLYNAFQFGDFLVFKITDKLKESSPSNMAKISQIDTFFERNFDIPQYYGGVREDFVAKFGKMSKIADCLSYLSTRFNIPKLKKAVDCIRDYQVLENIQNESVPRVLKGLFEYKDLKNFTTLDTEKSLKKLKNSILDLKPSWREKEIVLDDIREIDVDSISVKNFKKTITISCELSIILNGVSKGNAAAVNQSYNVIFDFINENGVWKASSFNFCAI